MSGAPFHSIRDLPDTLAVFPLPGVLLFPRWPLPLNIFEPRYLNMVDDAMAGNRLIGMIQSTGGERQAPDLAAIGCVGRITSYSETEDGRYLITLTGLARFRVAEELDVRTPYRQVRADWTEFADDFHEPDVEPPGTRAGLIAALNIYSDAKDMSVDWDAVGKADLEGLINALCAGCPFSVMEKQALLEAVSLQQRAERLGILLKMDSAGPDRGSLQ
ncbi:MAG: LON peptidase substrate-binding domain-containing protein [Hyphomonas sp.]|uniref:LON peptidase substrate-binding domain-containing protein n=1 Tax=Hyphomonas sp. TaxID=87 RepID=UPI003526EB48